MSVSANVIGSYQRKIRRYRKLLALSLTQAERSLIEGKLSEAQNALKDARRRGQRRPPPPQVEPEPDCGRIGSRRWRSEHQLNFDRYRPAKGQRCSKCRSAANLRLHASIPQLDGLPEVHCFECITCGEVLVIEQIAAVAERRAT